MKRLLVFIFIYIYLGFAPIANASMAACADSVDLGFNNGDCLSTGHPQTCPVSCYFNPETSELSLSSSDNHPVLFTITDVISGASFNGMFIFETSLTILFSGYYEIRITLTSGAIYIGHFYT